MPRGIQGEKLSKDMASSRNLVSTIKLILNRIFLYSQMAQIDLKIKVKMQKNYVGYVYRINEGVLNIIQNLSKHNYFTFLLTMVVHN